MISRYGHLKELLVSTGDVVSTGQVIALSGGAAGAWYSGWSTGPHLHFEIRRDDAVYDPLNLFPPDYVSGATGELAGASVGGFASSSKRVYGENEFQGAIKLRRITPDLSKDLDKIGANGEITSIGGEKINTDDATASSKEALVKTWTAGASLVVISENNLYEEKTVEKNGEKIGTGRFIKKKNESKQNIKVTVGTEVSYTGNYKVEKNVFNKEKAIVYVEVKKGEETGFIPSTSLALQSGKTSSIKTTDIEKALLKNNNNSDNKKEQLGTGKKYKIAISAGGNAENKEEVKMAIKIGKKLEEVLKDSYSNNFEIVQTGHKINKTIPDEKRAKNAEDLKPDLCVEIQLNSSNGNGVDAIFKENDGYSQELAEYLTKTVSKSLELEDNQAGTDVEKLGGEVKAINNYAFTKFPSAIVRAGNTEKFNDEENIKKYAEGIRDAIKLYFDSDHAAASSVGTREAKTTNHISSKVSDLRYVTKDEFDRNRSNNAVFTFDDVSQLKSAKVLTTTWDGKGKNGGINVREAFKKYTTPMEYLLYYYTDMDSGDVTEALCDEIIGNSEIIVALQDNTTTTRVNNGSKNTSCTTSIDATYARTWFIESMKESNYSTVALEMQGRSTITVDLQGEAAYKMEQDEEGNVYETLTCKYDMGEDKTRVRDQVFGDIYNKNEVYKKFRPEWIIRNVEKNEKTTHLTNMTKYLFYCVMHVNFGVDNEVDFAEEYKLQHFDNIQMLTLGNGGFVDAGEIHATVWWSLLSFGLNEYQVAGIMGNIEGESGFDPASTYGSAIGLCQWIDRAQKLKEYAASKGKDWTDVECQLKFLMGELDPAGTTPDGDTGYASYQLSGDMETLWKNANSVADATKAFMCGWERPCTGYVGGEGGAEHAKNLKKRQDAAQSYYDQFHGQTPPAGFYSVRGSGEYFTPGVGYVYRQVWEPWASQVFYSKYGTTYYYRTHGCGPCAVAMVVSDLTGTQVDPVQVWSWTNQQYAYTNGSGHDYPAIAGAHYGLRTENIGNDVGKAIACLQAGGEIVTSQLTGPLKGSGGHFVVIYGIEGNQVHVKQSGYGSGYSSNEDKTWDINSVIGSWSHATCTFNR